LDREKDRIFQEEKAYLKKTIAEIDRQLEELQKIPRYFGENITEQALDYMREEQKRHLNKALSEPYFGRLDFQEKGKERVPIYIGKTGIENGKTKDLLVVDWRAPIASMFYSFTGGDGTASYESPDGIIEGLIYLKRNLVIREQILQRVVDSYERGKDHPQITDEFLIYRLGENKDNRLRDIVSTIQEEQDRIIRSVKDLALIIQGVAGSGKTTVALHRIAYLLYRYREKINAEKIIIFAPNSMFLDYISNVLPELGVGGIQQTTFNSWVLEQLGEDIRLNDPSDQLAEWFAVGDQRPKITDQSPGRFKGSIRFMAMIERCLSDYEEMSSPKQDFEAWEGTILPVEQVKTWFLESQHFPMVKRRERVVNRIKKWTDQQLESIWDQRLKKELKKKSASRLKTYLKNWPDFTALSFYKQIFQDKQLDIPPQVRKRSLQNFKLNRIDQEDLAPLLYIHHRLNGIDRNQIFDHIVIDEAQDFSPFQIAVLKQRVRNHSFTILGDIAQSIHAYQGILDWQEFIGLFGEGESAFYQLNRSYRSTMEIIQFANQILAGVNEKSKLAEPVFRSGEKVRLIYARYEERIGQVLEAVRHFKGNHANTIAVVGRTEEDCKELHRALGKAGVEASLLHAGQREYGGGISVVPVYLTKGLEFDAVLIVDADDRNYTIEDAKLLYVGCTRALHQLGILYAGNPSPLVSRIEERYYTTKW